MRQKGDAAIAAGWLQNPESGQGYETFDEGETD